MALSACLEKIAETAAPAAAATTPAKGQEYSYKQDCFVFSLPKLKGEGSPRKNLTHSWLQNP